MWVGTAVLVVSVLLLTSYVQPIASWFQTPFWPALACFLPCFAFGYIGGHFLHRGKMSLAAFGGLALIGAAALQFFFATLVVLSKSPGNFALASLLILTLAFHGYVLRTTVQFPFTIASTVVALVGAGFVDPTKETWSLIAFVGITGLLVALLTGQAGLREHVDRLERDKLRQAIHYRALAENARAHDEMSERVVDLLRHNHDAGNTLSTVFLNAQLLAERVQKLGSTDTASLDPQVQRLLEQLERLKSLINRAHQLAEDPVVATVELKSILDSAVEECRGLYPGTRIDVGSVPSILLRLQEGEIGLRRILENLLHNACEGDGTSSALRLRIDVEVDGERATLRFTDDGPGFRAEQLDEPPTPFRTTKTQGSGLGLFSVNHLVLASGGSFDRRNGAEGRGAVVEVRLGVVVDEPSDAAAPSSESEVAALAPDSGVIESGERLLVPGSTEPIGKTNSGGE